MCKAGVILLEKKKKKSCAHLLQEALVRAPSWAKVNAARVGAINHLPNCDYESFLLLSAVEKKQKE